MHTPLRTAARLTPSLGVASLLSVLAHAGALRLVLCADAQIDEAASTGQRKGAITLRLTARPAPRAVLASAEPLVNQTATRASRHKVQPIPSGKLRPAPAPASPLDSGVNQAATEPPPSSAQEPTSHDTAAKPTVTPAQDMARPAQVAGAPFASLFAPLISRPMGRGHWRSSRSTAAPEPDPASLSQAQALMQTTQALQERMQSLAASLAAEPIQGPCQVTMDLNNRWAHVQCPQAQDTSRVWGFLRELLLDGSVVPTPTNSCVSIDGRALNWVACQRASAQASDTP